MKNKRLFSPQEAAAALGVSIRTLYRWEEAGNLSTVRTVGNQRRIPIEEIARLRRRLMSCSWNILIAWCVLG
jgi:excisionase family DNA binding protein